MNNKANPAAATAQDSTSKFFVKQDARGLQQAAAPQGNLRRLTERGLKQQDDSGHETAGISGGGALATPPNDKEIADLKTLLAQQLANLDEDLFLGQGEAADQYRESVYTRFLAWYH